MTQAEAGFASVLRLVRPAQELRRALFRSDSAVRD